MSIRWASDAKPYPLLLMTSGRGVWTQYIDTSYQLVEMKGLPRTVKNSNLIRTASLCIAVAMLCVAIVACGDSEDQTETPVSAQPAAAASQAATPERASPTAAPAVAAPTATTVATAAPATSGQATITVAAPFHPSSNGAIHTDDAFILSRLGVTETLLRIDFDGEVKPFLAESWELTGDSPGSFGFGTT